MNIPRLSVENKVAANFLMWFLIIAGLYYWFNLVRDFFPPLEQEQALLELRYTNASPEEIEKSVTRKVERAVEEIKEVEKVFSQVVEGASFTTVTFEDGADPKKLMNDLQNKINEIKSELPEEVEDPIFIEVRPLIPALGTVISGNISEDRLREEARNIRDDFLDLPEVSEIKMLGIRDREIWIEVYTNKLEEYRLTFEEVGRAVAAANLDIPGGELKSPLGNVQVKTMGEEEQVRKIEQIVVRANVDGSVVRLKDIAAVRKNYEDRVEMGYFSGKPAIQIFVFKTPEEDALKISSNIKAYIKEHSERLGGAAVLEYFSDVSRFIQQRLDLMLSNARAGFILVVLTLLLFLNVKVAFWTAAGILVSFLGTFVFMNCIGVTINLMSLFALILVLGLIVDDAIVVGENIFAKIRSGVPPQQAAIEGSSEVALPVIATVLTTIAAFLPLAFIDSKLGRLMVELPKVAIAALTISLLEAFMIMPAHLAGRYKKPGKFMDGIREQRYRFLEETLPGWLEKLLRPSLRWRYVTLVTALCFLIVMMGFIGSGIVPFMLIQEVDSEYMEIDLEMTAGTLEEETRKVFFQIEKMALELPEVKVTYAILGRRLSKLVTMADPQTIGQITLELQAAEEREKKGMRTCRQIINLLHHKTDIIPGVKSVKFRIRNDPFGDEAIKVVIKGKS